MKSRSTRTVLFLFLICLSLASYVYVNLDGRSQPPAAPEQAEEMDQALEDENAVNLPDIRMLRTVIETGKRILPAS